MPTRSSGASGATTAASTLVQHRRRLRRRAVHAAAGRRALALGIGDAAGGDRDHGADPNLDLSIAMHGILVNFIFQQAGDVVPLGESIAHLEALLGHDA